MQVSFDKLARLTTLTKGPAVAAASDTSPIQRRAEEVVALFEQFRSPLLRYVCGFGLTVHDSEEVVQEVFLALFQHLERGKPDHHILGWLFRVAHNIGLKARQRNRQDMEALGDVGAAANVVDPGLGPAEQFEFMQRRQRVHAVVQALPEQDRQCLTLRAEGLRYREIAAILDMSLGAVAGSLARSLARISRAVQRCD